LGLPNAPDQDLRRLIAYLPIFEHMANQPGSSKGARNLVRQLKGWPDELVDPDRQLHEFLR
jgi:hypothetical protein